MPSRRGSFTARASGRDVHLRDTDNVQARYTAGSLRGSRVRGAARARDPNVAQRGARRGIETIGSFLPSGVRGLEERRRSRDRIPSLDGRSLDRVSPGVDGRRARPGPGRCCSSRRRTSRKPRTSRASSRRHRDRGGRPRGARVRRRGERATRFLDPRLAHLTPARRDEGPRRGRRSRIARAVRAGERICVFGDYDADGVTARRS